MEPENQVSALNSLPTFVQEDARVLRSRVKEPNEWDASINEAQHEANRPSWLKTFPVW